LLLVNTTQTQKGYHSFQILTSNLSLRIVSTIATITVPHHHRPPPAYTKPASQPNPLEDVYAVSSAFSPSSTILTVSGDPVAIVAVITTRTLTVMKLWCNY
ncbi:hypothetical protein QBC32DRAFT_222846, partial [Pseudoneurospora amorphoporcata]